MPDLPRVRNQGRTTAGEEAGGGPRGSWHLFIGKPHDFDMRTRLVVLGVPFLFEKQPFIFETAMAFFFLVFPGGGRRGVGCYLAKMEVATYSCGSREGETTALERLWRSVLYGTTPPGSGWVPDGDDQRLAEARV